MPAFSRFLRYFVVVGRLRSIRRASEELHVSASAIDRQLLNVEAQLGIPLFERLPTGLRLTAAGEIMMAAGTRWQKELANVVGQIEGLRGLKRGHVDIAIIDALAKGYIPRVIRSIQSQYPGITISIRVLDNDEVRAAIVAGEVDFGIFFSPESYREISVRTFAEVVLGFVTPPDHPLARHAEARFSSCIGSRVIAPAQPLAMHQLLAILEGTSGATLDHVTSSDNIQMITSLVMQGAGIGIVTSLDVATEVRAGTLSFTRISDAILRPMTLALCTASNRIPSNAAEAVLAEIENGFDELLSMPGCPREWIADQPAR
jgi:DNA-binding transcriptional LysR family regulator